MAQRSFSWSNEAPWTGDERAASRRRRRWHRGRGVVLAAVAAALALPAGASAATVTGTAFEDFNDNGARDSAPMIDAGVGGIAVKAYGAGSAILAQDTTAPDGRFSLDVPDGSGRVRIEFTNLPAGYQPARHGSDSGTTVQFVTVGGGTVSGVDVGVLRPSQFCQNNPLLAVACSHFAEHTGAHAGDAAIRLVSDGTADQTLPPGLGPNQLLPGELVGATFGQVGAIFGTAHPQGSNWLYTAAYAKRHAGWGPGGPGAIYRTDVAQATGGTPNAEVFFDVNALPSQPAGTATRGTGGWIRDGDAFDIAGTRSLGNLVSDPDGRALYTVGLASRELIRIPIPGDGSRPALADVETYAIPHDACAVPADARPMAVGFHPDGTLYVGGVCSMASRGDPMPQPATAELSVYVRAFDPATETFAPAPVLDVPLDADRLCTNSGGVWPDDTLCSGSADWHPWTSARDAAAGNYYYAQPMLSDIDVHDGDLILGIRDRAGDQAGYDTRRADDSGSERVMSAGYTLRACDVGGTFVLESGGQCGSRVGGGYAQTPKYGPGGGLFYWQQAYGVDPATQTGGVHDYGGLGGLLTIPGYRDLRETAQNAVTVCPPGMTDNGCPTFPGPHTSAGVLYLDHEDGARSKGYTLYLHEYAAQNSTFGKANGLGDLEALCQSAPIEIGDFVWVDANRDGIQDPGESPIPGVVVELVDRDGRVIATTTTDADGRYYFNESNVPGGLQPETDYTVRIPLDQPALVPYVPTVPHAGEGQRDSNGVQDGRYVVAPVRTGPAGHNDHTFDFGFHEPARPSTPPPPVTEPPFNVGVVKRASAARVPLGAAVTYGLTVTNHGPGRAPAVRVDDPVPAQLRATGATTAQGSCSIARNVVACALGELAPGATVKVTVRATAIKSGRTVNQAEVVAPGDTDPRDDRSSATVVVRKGRLGLAKTVDRRSLQAGGSARFTITVRNPGSVPLRGVRVCDQLPEGLTLVRTSPRARLIRGQVCWSTTLNAKQVKRYRMTVRALRGASGKLVNRAVATAPDAATKRTQRPVQVISGAVRAGGVTG